MNRLALLITVCGSVVTADFPPYTTTDFDCLLDPAVSCSRRGICDDTTRQCVCSEGYFTNPQVNEYQCNSYDSSGLLRYNVDVESVQSSLDGNNLRGNNTNTSINVSMAGTGESFKCDFPPNDCSNHGVCNRNGTECICDDGYTTYKPDGNQQCNYERKKQIVAFGLAWIACTTGAPYFYLGDTTMGLLYFFFGIGGVITLAILACFASCFLACCGRKTSTSGLYEATGAIGAVIIVMIVLLALIWQIVLLFQTGLNKLNDVNGIALKSW